MPMPTIGTETGDITGPPTPNTDGDTLLMDGAFLLDLGTLARDLLMLSPRPRLMLMLTTGTETGDITGLPILDSDTSLNTGTLTSSHMDMDIPLSIGSFTRDLLMLSQRPRLMLMPTTGTETGDITGLPTPDPDGDTSLDI